MAIYPERDALSILSFAADLEGADLFISKVNGDPAMIGVPIPLSVGGAVTIGADGIVLYDDEGLPMLAEGERRYDSVIVAISDGVNEVETSVNLEIFGQGVLTANTVTFGSETRAGAGGFAVEGTQILSGDPDGHFEIIDGLLVPSVTGQGVLADSYLLTFDTGAPVLVEIAERRLDVRDAEQLAQAVTAAEALNPATDFEVVLRDGITFGTEEEAIRIEDVRMSGTLSDANAGASNFLFDDDVIPSLSGGSVTLRPETPLGAAIAAPVEVTGATLLRFSGIDFTLAADPGSAERFDHGNGVAFAGEAADLVQLTLLPGAADPGTILVEDCRFTAPDGTADGHRARGVLAEGMGTVIIADSHFDGVYAGIETRQTARTSVLRNFFTSIIGDAVIAGNSSETGTRLETAANTAHAPLDSSAFAGVEAGFLCMGDTGEIDAFIHRNYVHAPVPARTGGGQNVPRQSSGIRSEGASVTGEVSHNFILASGPYGIRMETGEFVSVSNNTLVPDTQSTPLSADQPVLDFGASFAGGIAQNNVAIGLVKAPGAGATSIGNYLALDPLDEDGANSYDAIFTGDFGFAAGTGPTFTLDASDADSLRTDIEAIFDTDAAGIAAGKGFGRITVPVVRGFPEVGRVLEIVSPDPEASYLWRRNGVNIAGATDTSYTILPEDDGLVLSAVKVEGGQFAFSADIHVGAMFKIDNGVLTDPDDQPFAPKGFNIFAGHYAFSGWAMDGLIGPDGGFTADGLAALQAWGVTMLRLNLMSETAFTFTLASDAGTLRSSGGFTDPAALIAAATAAGIVTLIAPTGWDAASFASVNGATALNPVPEAPDADTQSAIIALLRKYARDHADNPYVWFEPYSGRGGADDWAGFHQPAITAIRTAGNLNPVIINAPFGQDLETEDSDLSASPLVAAGSSLTGGNIGFDIHLADRFRQQSEDDLASYFAALDAAGLWAFAGDLGGINAGSSLSQTRFFAAKRAIEVGLAERGATLWHGGLAVFPITTAGDPTGIDDLTAPGNLTDAGHFFWTRLFGNTPTGQVIPVIHITAIKAEADGSHSVTFAAETGGGEIRILGQSNDALPTPAQIDAGQDGTGAAAAWSLTVEAPKAPGSLTVTVPQGLSVSHLAAYQLTDPAGNAGTSDVICLPLAEGGLFLTGELGTGEVTVGIETLTDNLTLHYAVVERGVLLDADAIRSRAAAGTDAGTVTLATAGSFSDTLTGLPAGSLTIYAVIGDSRLIAITELIQGVTEIVHKGVTVSWNEPANAGVLETGDIIWIEGAVTGLHASPEPESVFSPRLDAFVDVHGMQGNPQITPATSGSPQAYDGRAYGYDASYGSNALDLDPAWPSPAGKVKYALKFVSVVGNEEPENFRQGLSKQQIGIVCVDTPPTGDATSVFAAPITSWAGRTAGPDFETIDTAAWLSAQTPLSGSSHLMPPYQALADTLIQESLAADAGTTRPVSNSIDFLEPYRWGGDVTNDGRYKSDIIDLALIGIMSDVYTFDQRVELLNKLVHQGKQIFQPLDSLVDPNTGLGTLVNGQIWRHITAPLVLYLALSGQEDALDTLKERIGTNQLRQPVLMTPELVAELEPHLNYKAIASSFTRTLQISAGDPANRIGISPKTSPEFTERDAFYVRLDGMYVHRISDGAEAVIVNQVERGALTAGVYKMDIAAQPTPPFANGDQVYFRPYWTIEEGDVFWNIWDDKQRRQANMYMSPAAAYFEWNTNAIFNLFFRWAGMWHPHWRATEDLSIRKDTPGWPSASFPAPTDYSVSQVINGQSYSGVTAEFGNAHAATLRALPYGYTGRPDFFRVGDWSVTDAGGGQLEVTVSVLPEDFGLPISEIEWTQNDGATVQTLALSPTAGTYTINASGPIRLRAKNAKGVSISWSAAKSAS